MPLQAPIFSPIVEYKFMWHVKWGNSKQGLLQPYLLSCLLPETHWHMAPQTVSIVENVCDKATNNLRVIYNKLEGFEAKKEEFAVCVKGLDFPDTDLSIRLTEWLETLASLGASKVFFYNLSVHPNVAKVLEYYERKGLVRFFMWLRDMFYNGRQAPHPPNHLTNFSQRRLIH